MPKYTVVDLFEGKAVKRVLARPFVKWAGGKGSLLSTLEKMLPADFDEQENVTYIEPFVGGGAMLFHMLRHHKCIKKVVINDINPDLIHCYRLIKDNPEALIERLRQLEHNFFHEDIHDKRDLYYAYREQYNRDDIEIDARAALFIFLNHTCFNGLYRVNASGKFNVPMGRYKHPIICNEELIIADHKVLNSVDVSIKSPGGYKQVLRNTKSSNYVFVYLDPPYRPLLNNNNFKDYSNSPFGDREQEGLKKFCDKLWKRDCRIMISNSDSRNEDGSSYFEQLYDNYEIHRILAPRFINANGNNRVKLNEILIRNYR